MSNHSSFYYPGAVNRSTDSYNSNIFDEGQGSYLGKKRPFTTSSNDGNDDNHGDMGNNKKRFVWPESLHKDFIGAVFDVGLKFATNKEVQGAMNVEKGAFSQDQLRSHLQKYRLYRDRKRFPRKLFYEMECNGLDDSFDTLAQDIIPAAAPLSETRSTSRMPFSDLVKLADGEDPIAQEDLDAAEKSCTAYLAVLKENLQKVHHTIKIQSAFAEFMRYSVDVQSKIWDSANTAVETLERASTENGLLNQPPSSKGDMSSDLSHHNKLVPGPGYIPMPVASVPGLPLLPATNRAEVRIMSEMRATMDLHRKLLLQREDQLSMHGPHHHHHHHHPHHAGPDGTMAYHHPSNAAYWYHPAVAAAHHHHHHPLIPPIPPIAPYTPYHLSPTPAAGLGVVLSTNPISTAAALAVGAEANAASTSTTSESSSSTDSVSQQRSQPHSMIYGSLPTVSLPLYDHTMPPPSGPPQSMALHPSYSTPASSSSSAGATGTTTTAASSTHPTTVPSRSISMSSQYLETLHDLASDGGSTMGGNSQLPSRLSSTGSNVVTFSHLVAEVSDTIDRFAASHQPTGSSTATTAASITTAYGEPTNNNSSSNSSSSNGLYGHPHSSSMTNGLLKSPPSTLLQHHQHQQQHPTDLSITSRSNSDNNTSTVGDIDLSQRSANPSRGVSNALSTTSAMLPAALSTSELNTLDLDALDGDALFSFLLNTN